MLVDPRGRLISLVRRAAGFLAIGILVLGGAEFGSRLDDWMFLDVSPLANPTNDSELRLRDDGFLRGRPNGRFKRWQLHAVTASSARRIPCFRAPTAGA